MEHWANMEWGRGWRIGWIGSGVGDGELGG